MGVINSVGMGVMRDVMHASIRITKPARMIARFCLVIASTRTFAVVSAYVRAFRMRTNAFASA